MDWSSRFRNAGFWISSIAFILLVLQEWGVASLPVPSDWETLFELILTILVALGIINDPTTSNRGYADDK